MPKCGKVREEGEDPDDCCTRVRKYGNLLIRLIRTALSLYGLSNLVNISESVKSADVGSGYLSCGVSSGFRVFTVLAEIPLFPWFKAGFWHKSINNKPLFTPAVVRVRDRFLITFCTFQQKCQKFTTF